ncbi:protein JTB [Agrilus planipennis]|uniref:Protein JTB n=1 Tax=Agrilus planipennis TaxID=224129 RepID=A0A1W4W3I3_AGRPL|nr:protein JTB [Agrilus planipennis]
MIETCPRKRMLLGISLLGALTILVLIAESHWTDRTNHKKQNFVVEHNATCFEKEPFEIVKECEPCTAFEIASKTSGVCIHTHYKEVLKCKSGDTVTRSCDRVAYLEEKAFWRFEGFMFVFSVVSTVSVFARRNVLTKRMMHRVQKQLANSV